MQIQVRCNCGEGDCSEWAIIELQGLVESQTSIGDEIRNLEIGRLCHSSCLEGSYTFTVGYHELTGTKMILKKPLLVLQKSKTVVNGGDKRGELQIVGIIRQKILFKTRPKALISRSHVKERKVLNLRSSNAE
ncbi:hypothetical protein ZOSMA_277G00060 [Zostera marina]|uniref:Chromosome transmission fidelity protein 8 n=1 Tax=Zostera marina TaxID=29655 RepID=A0A0K9PG20_ZOSMR|nr:hypothetical protein ZOSMA_277G00060 [Zostera marina]